jgi:DNA topoisomerase-3
VTFLSFQTRDFCLLGWKKALETESRQSFSKPADEDNKQELPAVKKGEQLLCDHLKLLDKLTQPPKHYTEGTLIKAMETIGTQPGIVWLGASLDLLRC